MGRNGHKRKNNHVVIVTSDATDVRMRQFRIRPWILQVIIIFQCIVIGALIGFVLYEREAWGHMNIIRVQGRQRINLGYQRIKKNKHKEILLPPAGLFSKVSSVGGM